MNEAQEYLRKPKEWFATTRWSVILNAKSRESDAEEALEELCQTYWYPVYYFIRSRGASPEDAKDQTQEFFCRLIQKDFLAAVKQENGRFRTFLRCCVNRFLAKEWRKDGAEKRGGHAPVISIDDESVEVRLRSELRSSESPDRTFDRQWALVLLSEARNRLQEEYGRDDQRMQFERISQYLIPDQDAGTYAEAAVDLRMTEAAVAKAVHRMRKNYSELIRAEVARTLARTSDIDEELRHLRAALEAKGR